MPLPADGPVTPGDLLTLEALGHFRRTSTLRGVGLVLHAWGVIAGAIALYLLWPSALTLAVAVLVIGARQLGLMVLMHETAHWLLFREGRLNTWVGTWLCACAARRGSQGLSPTASPAPPAHADPRGSRPGALGAAAGLARAAGPGAPGRPLRVDGAHAHRGAGGRGATASPEPGAGPGRPSSPTPCSAPCSRRSAAGRSTCSRGCCPGRRGSRSSRGSATSPSTGWSPTSTTRSGTRARSARGSLARAFVAPYGVNYHLEHHLLVFVPCWKLREVQALLVAKGLGGRMERAASYVEVLARATGGSSRGRSPSGWH